MRRDSLTAQGAGRAASGASGSGSPTQPNRTKAMVNRIVQYREEPDGEGPEGDYWEVGGDAGWFYVSAETARELARQLAGVRTPRWLRFTDLFGAEVQVLAREVSRVSECTEGQRAAERRFRHARRLEEKADRRPWEDDDW